MKDEISTTLNSIHLADSIPNIQEYLYSPISNFITLDANDCGYEGSIEYLIVSYLHPLFLTAKADASQADNTNWRQSMSGQFSDKYWEAAVNEI